MTAEGLYIEFCKATRVGQPLTFDELPEIHRQGWEAVLAKTKAKVLVEFGINPQTTDYAKIIRELGAIIHYDSRQWWHDLETSERLDRNFGELISLAHSELSEAIEGHRKNLMDNHLPHRKMVEVELADAIIRILDTAAGYGMDVGTAVIEKMEYNRHRADHKAEARKLADGKKY